MTENEEIDSGGRLFLSSSDGRRMQKDDDDDDNDDDDDDNDDGVVESILASMTLEEKIGQMSQIDMGSVALYNETLGKVVLDMDKIRHVFGDLQVGSIFNTPTGVPLPEGMEEKDVSWSAADYRAAIAQIASVGPRLPVIWALDSVHGANYVRRAVLTPQQLSVAATFNQTCAAQAGSMIGRQSRQAGVLWVFSPLVGISLRPQWGRVYETFGEDVTVVSEMVREWIRGIQQQGVAACAKHFVGYSMPRTYADRAPSWIPVRHLHQYFVPPWKVAIQEAQVDTVMESYTEYDGVPNAANQAALHTLLRHQLQFDGLLVTDYDEIFNLAHWHSVTPNTAEAVKLSLRETSIDVGMVPFDVNDFQSHVLQAMGKMSSDSPLYPLIPTEIDQDRIDQSVRRILKLKHKLGLLANNGDEANPQRQGDDVPDNDDDHDDPVNADDRKIALDMAHQSVVLAKNKGNTLPLSASSTTLHITGPTSDSISYQCGGWTTTWQGVGAQHDDWIGYGITLWQSAQSLEWKGVSQSCGVSIVGATDCSSSNSINDAVEKSKSANTVVVALGEENYAEKPGDISSLRLPQGQYDLVKALSALETKIVVVYFGGRPRLLAEIEDLVDAIVVAFLPGPDGGQAVMDVLTGHVNPSGRLPITYPTTDETSPYFHAVSNKCTEGDGPLPHWVYKSNCRSQWPFGHGLSYATFTYTDLTVSSSRLVYTPRGYDKANGDNDSVRISVTVTNSGDRAGAETVLFFTFDESRYVTPEYKRLRHFSKIWLEAQESQTVTAELSLSELRHVGPHDETHTVLQEGMRFRVGVGPHSDCRSDEDNDDDQHQNVCTDFIAIHSSHGPYVGACDAACGVWDDTGCGDALGFSSRQCWEACTTIAKSTTATAGGQEGWGWNYVNCIEGVAQGFSSLMTTPSSECEKLTLLCRDVFRTPTWDEHGHGPVKSGRNGDDVINEKIEFALSMLATLVGALCICHAFGVNFLPRGRNVARGDARRRMMSWNNGYRRDLQMSTIVENGHEQEEGRDNDNRIA